MTRPVNLKITTFRFPIAAITSILHRITGFILFFGVGYFTYLLSLTLASREGFEWVVNSLRGTYHSFLFWVVLTALIYHALAGIRHLLLDFHIGDSLVAGRISSWLVIALTVFLSVAAIGWLVG